MLNVGMSLADQIDLNLIQGFKTIKTLPLNLVSAFNINPTCLKVLPRHAISFLWQNIHNFFLLARIYLKVS